MEYDSEQNYTGSLLTTFSFFISFHYHHQINDAIKEINSLKNLVHVKARFVIPKFPKKKFHNFYGSHS